MVLAALLLFQAGLLDTKPAPVYAEVLVGSRGPYRFLVDTGSQTSLIEPDLATELGLKAQFRVEIVTQLSTRLRPGLKATTLRVGKQALPPLELVFDELPEAKRLDPTVRGLLGVNALEGLNFALKPGEARIDFVERRPAGEVVAFERLEDRIAIVATMGQESLRLILDSGSSHVVLFRTPKAMAKTRPVVTTFATLEGARATVPTTWTADLVFTARLKIGMQAAAIVERRNTVVEGLLPASIFKQVYVDQQRREVVLVR